MKMSLTCLLHLLIITFLSSCKNELTLFNNYTSEYFEVYEKDLDKQMTWSEAKRACKKLGEGWRLPTMDELEIIDKMLYTRDKGNFKSGDIYNASYWSSNPSEESFWHAYFYNFDSGGKYTNLKDWTYNVRPVRSVL